MTSEHHLFASRADAGAGGRGAVRAVSPGIEAVKSETLPNGSNGPNGSDIPTHARTGNGCNGSAQTREASMTDHLTESLEAFTEAHASAYADPKANMHRTADLWHEINRHRPVPWYGGPDASPSTSDLTKLAIRLRAAGWEAARLYVKGRMHSFWFLPEPIGGSP